MCSQGILVCYHFYVLEYFFLILTLKLESSDLNAFSAMILTVLRIFIKIEWNATILLVKPQRKWNFVKLNTSNFSDKGQYYIPSWRLSFLLTFPIRKDTDFSQMMSYSFLAIQNAYYTGYVTLFPTTCIIKENVAFIWCMMSMCTLIKWGQLTMKVQWK